MKLVKVIWQWDDGTGDFFEWFTAADSMTEESARTSFMHTFVKRVRHGVVIKSIEFTEIKE